MTKVVISGYYGFGNFGDETILSILVNHLKSLNADITVLSGNIEYTKKHNSVNAINRFDIKNVAKIIKSSDILISGGGSLLQDATSLKSLIYYLFIIALGVLYNKKVLIFAQGIGPIKNRFAKVMTRFLIKQCYYVSVRDEKSFELLKTWDIASDLVPDPVFSIDVEQRKGEAIGVQLRNFNGVNISFLQNLAQFINSKFSDNIIKIFSLQESYDFDLCKNFEQMLKNTNPNIKTEIITENIIENITDLEYLFGMRFHALLIAVKAGVKSCAINYDIKVENFAKEYNLPVISLSDNNNFEKIFIELENSRQSQNVLKTIDWSKYDEIINNN